MAATESEYYRYLKLIDKNKRLFIITALAIMTAVVIVSYLLPKKYEAKSTVFIEKNVINDLVKGLAATPSMMNESSKVLSYGLTSRTLLVKVINEVDFNLKTKNDAEIELLLNDLQKDTKVKVTDKDLFIISFRHSNPRIARDYVNTLVRSYIEQNVSAKREESYGATKFLSEQIETYKDKMDKATAAANQFKAGQGVGASLDEGRLQQEIMGLRQKLYELKLRKRQLEEEKSFAEKNSDPFKLKAVALRKKLEELRAQYTDNYPEVKNVKSQLDSLNEEMAAQKGGNQGITDKQDLWKLEAEIKAIRENEGEIQRNIDESRRLLGAIAPAKAMLEKLEADKTNQKNMYDLIYMRQNQSEFSKQMELQDKSSLFRIVDPAVSPVFPVSPNRQKLIMMGIMAGLAGGLGLLLIVDHLDHSVKMVDNLGPFGLPILAVVPLIKSADEVRLEERESLRLYVMSACYFSLILAVLAMEALGITIIDRLISKLGILWW